MTFQQKTTTFRFYGDSLIDRKSIVTLDPCSDLPAIGSSTQVLQHETAGFYKRLQQMLQITQPLEHIQFENYARGGSKAWDIRTQLESKQDLKVEENVNAIFLCVGTNDASHPYFGLADAISTETFTEHYDEILDTLSPQCGLLYCILPPPVRVEVHSDEINRQLAAFNQAILGLELQYLNVTAIDLFTHFQNIDAAFASANPHLSLRIEDGVHFSDLGNQLAADIIWDSMEHALFNF